MIPVAVNIISRGDGRHISKHEFTQVPFSKGHLLNTETAQQDTLFSSYTSYKSHWPIPALSYTPPSQCSSRHMGLSVPSSAFLPAAMPPVFSGASPSSPAGRHFMGVPVKLCLQAWGRRITTGSTWVIGRTPLGSKATVFSALTENGNTRIAQALRLQTERDPYSC